MTEKECPVPTQFAKYLETIDQRRVDHRETMLGNLTERERDLVREAAVMGYVQGRMRPDQPVPPDSVIMELVLDACADFADLYPTLDGER